MVYVYDSLEPDMQGPKKSGFNVSSAYVLKSDMESSFPVDAGRGMV